jgi:glutamate synthase domain-containing protein 2
MIELKLSQGAKPGHGGVLPAAKITPEIAEARGVPMGRGLRLARRAPGIFHAAGADGVHRPAARAVGRQARGLQAVHRHRREFMCIVKAMLETGIVPDFIVVDGKEGGTGAAPLEFANHVGMPLVEG